MLIGSSISFPGYQLDHEVSAMRTGLYPLSIGSEKGDFTTLPSSVVGMVCRVWEGASCCLKLRSRIKITRHVSQLFMVAKNKNLINSLVSRPFSGCQLVKTGNACMGDQAK